MTDGWLYRDRLGAASASGGGGAGALLRRLHIPWPAADENKLREAAAAWHDLAETIRDSYGTANRVAVSVMTNNAGAAINAFEDHWQKYGRKGSGALPLAATACAAMSSACSDYADAVAHIKSKIEEAGLEVAAVLTAGTIGAFFTFGATEEAAGAIAAGLLSRVVALINDLAGTAFEVSQTAEAVVGSALAGIPVGAVGTLSADAGVSAVRAAFGDELLSVAETRSDVLKGLLAGGVGGFLGKVGELSSAQLAKLLSAQASTVATSDPQLFVDMMQLSKSLSGATGRVATGVAADAATQLMLSQQLNARDLTGGALEKALEESVQASIER